MIVDPLIPADQAMLLRLIDAKFETSNAKLDGISATLTVMNDRFGVYDKRFEDHEHRISAAEQMMAQRALQVADYEATKRRVEGQANQISALEQWQTAEKTTADNVKSWGRGVWAVIGGGVTTGLMFVATLYFQAQPPATVHPNVQINHPAASPTPSR